MYQTHLSRRATLIAMALGFSVKPQPTFALASLDEATRFLACQALDSIAALPAPIRAEVLAIASRLPDEQEQAFQRIGLL